MLLALQSLLSGGSSARVPVSPTWLLAAPPRGFGLAAPSRGFTLFAAARGFVLKALAMPLIGDFPTVDPLERVPLSIDFAAQLPTGDSLAAVISVSLAAFEGTDGAAAALLSGSGTVSGTKVSQFAGPGWIAGVVYRFSVTATTTSGATLSLYAHIACAPVN